MTGYVWINSLLADISDQLLVLEEAGHYPSELRVHREVYRSFAHLRSRELHDGWPLVVLGTPVLADPDLEIDDFVLIP